jgi:FlaA1/EpsC-like NDP-sugar epimerase
MKDFYKGKNILLTGAAGTVGREIVKQLVAYEPKELRLMDNNESDMFFLMEEYGNDNVFCFLGDIRDRDKLEKLSKDVDIVIHSAAFKHVYLSEYNPFDVVQTNIIGVENVIRAAAACNVKQVLFTSSDKAVNPTNVMGTSKLMGERLMTAASAVRQNSSTIFSSTRFGNVLGSRGSVVPLFMKQIKAGGPITLTDKRMTRFVMTIADAANLVLQSVLISSGGEVFVTKMPVVRIPDLAEAMIKILAPRYGHDPKDIKIVEIGMKAGEKLYEELMTDQEVPRSIELKNMFAVTPAFKALFQSIKHEYPDTISTTIDNSYISENEEPLGVSEIEKYLTDNKVLETVDGFSYGSDV